MYTCKGNVCRCRSCAQNNIKRELLQTRGQQQFRAAYLRTCTLWQCSLQSAIVAAIPSCYC
eukprot:6814-Heterococcus_DN1.PRE.2